MQNEHFPVIFALTGVELQLNLDTEKEENRLLHEQLQSAEVGACIALLV